MSGLCTDILALQQVLRRRAEAENTTLKTQSTMKKIITSIILPLLLIAAVVVALVWLLPVKVTLTLVIITQMIMLIALGTHLPQKPTDHEQEEV